MHFFKEIVRFRSLIAALVVRHLKARYRGSGLGFLWSLLNPLCLMLIYVLVFQYYIRFNQVEPYAAFILCGLLPWQWFAAALGEGTSAIVSGGHLITKSMFPAHLLPMVATITTMIHFLLALPILLILLLFSHVNVGPIALLLPIIIALQFVFSFGLVLGLSSLNVRFRDVQHLVTNFLTFLFFLCPVVYPASAVPAAFRPTLEFNPLAVLIMCYQKILFFGESPSLFELGFLTLTSVVVLFLGLAIYESSRERFAEIL